MVVKTWLLVINMKAKWKHLEDENTSGSNKVIGKFALKNNISGNGNVAIGESTLTNTREYNATITSANVYPINCYWL